MAGLVALITLVTLVAPQAHATTSGPFLRLKTAVGPPTSTVKVTGGGFSPHESVAVDFDAAQAMVTTAGSLGKISTSFTVPAFASPGSHPVVATGSESGASAVASFLVRTDWQRFRSDGGGTGNDRFENVLSMSTAPALVNRWAFTTGGPVESSPAVVGGVVYVGSYDGSVFAVDARLGSQVWRFQTGGLVGSSPAVAGGIVYIGSDDGDVYALKAATGALVWSFATGGPVRSSPDVVGGVVYVGSDDGNLYALRAKDGGRLWSFPTGGPVEASPAVAGGVVYVGSNASTLSALNADGTLKWSFRAGGAIRSSPAVAGGAVVFGSDDSNYYSLSAGTGGLNWKHVTGGRESSSPAISLIEGAVFFGMKGWNVEGDSLADGVKRWSFTSDASVFSSPAVANGVVYAGGSDGSFYALKSNIGQSGGRPAGSRTFFPRLLYSFATRGAVNSSPAVSDGMVFVGSDDGALYAFGLPAP